MLQGSRLGEAVYYAMDTEFLFPPRCCEHPIPFEDNRHLLDAEVARKFPKKALEYSTPNRTYCHNPLCVGFIPQNQHEDSVAVCGEYDAHALSANVLRTSGTALTMLSFKKSSV